MNLTGSKGLIKTNTKNRQRIIVSTDFPPLDCFPGGANFGPPEKKSDLDDIQSMVRFLCYSNEFNIEALIASSATFANFACKDGILDIVDEYAEVYENLCLHDPLYPSPEDLRTVTKVGLSGSWGVKQIDKIIGDGLDTEASEHIISVIDHPDPNPVWVCFWGGPRELGQALWKVKQTRSESDVARFVSKLRVYFVGLQDGSGQWILENFPELKTITLHLYHGMVNRSMFDGSWLRENIVNHHGPLGAVYPTANWVCEKEGVYEGDTPSYLYLVSGAIGLSDPEKPWFGGWGGAFQSHGPNRWEGSEEAIDSIAYWETALNWDFAGRMDWCVKRYEDANHHPIAILNHDSSKQVLYKTVAPEEKVSLSAKGSFDPDGRNLSYHWFQYVGDENTPHVGIENEHQSEASLAAPQEPCEIHVILEVTNDGSPPLTGFRRLVIKVEER